MREDTDIVEVGLRLRESLRKQIELRAKSSGRSRNAEIVAIIENCFNDDCYRRLEERIARLEVLISWGQVRPAPCGKPASPSKT